MAREGGGRVPVSRSPGRRSRGASCLAEDPPHLKKQRRPQAAHCLSQSKSGGMSQRGWDLVSHGEEFDFVLRETGSHWEVLNGENDRI